MVDVESYVADILQLEGRVTRKKQYSMLCIAHEDSRPSCDVDLKTGFWNCWSCDAGGDLVDLAIYVHHGAPKNFKRGRLRELRRQITLAMGGGSDPDARMAANKRRLQTLRRAAVPEQRARRSWHPTVPPAGSYAPGPLTYLRERGFSVPTLKRWGVRYSNRVVLERDPSTVGEDDNPHLEIHNVVCIPVIDNGSTVMWTYRATPESDRWMREGAKYIHTPGVDKQRYWFGSHLIEDFSEVAVTEGPLDAMWLDQAGLPAVANFGTHLKNESANLRKIDYLCSFGKVVLFFDKDTGGAQSTAQIGALLQKRGVHVRVATYPSFTAGAKDPQDLAGFDAQLMYWRAMPWLRWHHTTGG